MVTVRRLLLTCVVALVAASSGLTGGARQAAPAATGDGRIRIAAVVTNPRGEPVAGLRTRDFELRADGVAQELESVQLMAGPTDTPRLFALLLDEFHVDPASTARVRDALLRFMEAHVRPSDRVIVLKPGDSLMSIEPADDRARLQHAIASFQGRKGDYAARTLFEQKYMPQAPGAVAVARAQIVTSALRALTARIAEMTDLRPAIVFVSDGFARTRTTRESPADLQSTIRPAAGAAVPVYVLSASNPAPAVEGEAERGLAALRALATQTGGEYTAGGELLDAALARVSRDLDTHYVLTYRPSHGFDGRFHALQLAVKRRDAQVRARSGYLAPMSAQMRAARVAAQTSWTGPRPLRRSPLIHAWTGFTRTAEGAARVTVTWEPKRLTGSIRRSPPEAIVLTASRPDGEVIFQGRLAPVGAPKGETRDAAAFEAPAGRLLIDMNVVDGAGAVLDFDARDLEVPDLQKPGGIMLPASVLRARSAREFRSVSTDPYASPVPSREFRRTDRLLVRVPAYDSGAGVSSITATLLNGWRQPMRTLPAMPGTVADGITQFDVPLAPLAPGEYVIRINGPGGAEHVAFRVTG
jgi:VWFA-related protein